MALPVRQQITYWTLTAAVFLLLMWALGNVILPFIVGMAIAYFLDPVADRLERMGLSRIMATVVISLAVLLIVVLALLIVVPVLIEQLVGLVQSAPEIFANLRNFMTERFPSLIDEGSTLNRSLQSLGQAIQDRGGELVQTILASVSSVANIIVFIVVVPVVSFYMLKDWDRMVAEIDRLLPRDHADTIRDLAGKIDRTLASFVRGQGTVCLILGTFYAVALMAVGLNFGLIVGFVAGLLTFIPYLGALIGGALAVGLAFFQFWGEWGWIIAVAAIFQAGQLVEGNVLTPNLVGSSIGLHPVWLIFALSAFGSLFGFVGVLVAVPVAAIIGVLTRFFVERYQQGRLYRGLSGAEEDPAQEVHSDAAE